MMTSSGIGTRGADHEFPCPVCGYLVFDGPPGTFAICPVCRWEDDDTQLRWPALAGGANSTSLIEAQREFGRTAVDGNLHYVLDPAWRPIDSSRDDVRDDFQPGQQAEWPRDRTGLYYWRPTYWRRSG
ncbi:MAG TPA: CPCC family cysteine-rich protein [Candidatus Dormibacteraeota bacterium]|nr:CPCC family cysteine-rich protein [Candidatus Dormibacteraeota bacterium]